MRVSFLILAVLVLALLTANVSAGAPKPTKSSSSSTAAARSSSSSSSTASAPAPAPTPAPTPAPRSCVGTANFTCPAFTLGDYTIVSSTQSVNLLTSCGLLFLYGADDKVDLAGGLQLGGCRAQSGSSSAPTPCQFGTCSGQDNNRLLIEKGVDVPLVCGPDSMVFIEPREDGVDVFTQCA